MRFIEANYRKLILACGFLFFSFLFFLSWVFYKERVLAFDPSFFAFQMIDSKGFSIALGRWGAVFSEILPLLALKSNCSMETFLRLFSVAPIINYFIVFLIIIGLKNYRAALALMLTLCLGFRHAFYYTTAELYFGLALSILFWALIAPETEYRTLTRKRIALAASLVLIYIMSYLHQLTLFALVFIIIGEFIGNKRYRDKTLWLVFGATLVWFFIRIFVLKSTAYESEKIPTLAVFKEQLPSIWYSPSAYYFKHFAFSWLWPLFLTFFISWILLFRMKRWLYFLFLPAFSIAFLVLIVVTYYKGESPLMYENYYTVFGVFAGVSLMFGLYHLVKEKWRLIIVFPLLLISLTGMYNAHAILTKRVEYIDRLVDYGREQEKQKLLLSMQNFPWQYGWVDWSVPFETALCSALDGPDKVVTAFVTTDMNKYDTLIHRENIFLGPEWAVTWFGSQNLRKQYFHFPSGGYEKISTLQTDTSFHAGDFNKDNIKLEPLKSIYYADADSFVVAEIKIRNTSGKPLASIPSGANPTLLSYHVYDQGGKQIIADGMRTPLETDVPPGQCTTGLTVRLPKEKGDYTIEADLVTENVRWWGINSRFVLSVK